MLRGVLLLVRGTPACRSRGCGGGDRTMTMMDRNSRLHNLCLVDDKKKDA